MSFPKSFKLNKSLKPTVSSGVSPKQQISLKALEIYVTPSDKFVIYPRYIFKNNVLTHKTAKESNVWLAAPHIKYWDQQLNFAVWCATTGCGISMSHLFNSNLQIRSFCRFHVYFTIRRILHEMEVALPDDSVFNALDNPYNKVKYELLCSEFGVTEASDFRYREGQNNGLGYGYEYYTGRGPVRQKNAVYNGHDFFLSADNVYYTHTFFGKKKHIRPDSSRAHYYFFRNDGTESQYNNFIVNDGNGLTSAGLARLNESIEAYVYCILGAQANIRSTIIGNTGSAQQVRKEFTVLLEDEISNNDKVISYRRYQDTVTNTGVKLDLAISPNLLLLPSKMVILSGPAIAGYNNELQYATEDMKFGVNDDINTEVKENAIHEMEGTEDPVQYQEPQPEPPEPPELPESPKPVTPDIIHEHTKMGMLSLAVLVSLFYVRI